MEDPSPMYLTKEAIKNLNKKLSLPILSPYSQDWEYEQADSSRVQEFMTYYENSVLTNNEKFALMALIVSSYDDYLSEGNTTESVWINISNYLIKDFKLHKNTIIYWAQEDNEIEDCFAVTPLMREIIERYSYSDCK